MTTLAAPASTRNQFIGHTSQVPRPSRATEPYADAARLANLQALWDAAKALAEQNVQARAAHIASVESARQARLDDAAAAELAAMKERHRAAYLAQPGATEAGFAASWPGMLEALRIDEATHGADRLLDEARAITPSAF